MAWLRKVNVMRQITPSSIGSMVERGMIARVKTFGRNEDGSIIILSLYLFVAMLLISGMAVDLMRSETERAKLQYNLDRCSLSAASLEQALDSKEVLKDCFTRVGLIDYLKEDSIIVTSDAFSKSVTAEAEMSVPSMFMQLLGVDSLQAPAAGTAEEGYTNVEVSLIVDISGSMDDDAESSYDPDDSSTWNLRKIDVLKSEGKDFVFRMMCAPEDEDGVLTGDETCSVAENTVSVSLIPYSEQVVAGSRLLSEYNVSNEHTYNECVDFQAQDYVFDDTNKIAGFYDMSLADYHQTGLDTLYRTGHIDPYSYWSSGTHSANRTCKIDNSRQVVPFENSYSTLQTKIQALPAQGGTSVDIGMRWGVALLDPRTRPVINDLISGGSPIVDVGLSGRPYNYNQSGNEKVVILMTDGQNTYLPQLKNGFRSGASAVWKNDRNNEGWVSDDSKHSIYRASTDKYYHLIDGTWQDDPYGEKYVWRRYYNNGWRYYKDYDSDDRGNPYNIDFVNLWKDYPLDYYDRFSWLPDPAYFNPRTTNMSDGSSSFDASRTMKDNQLLGQCAAAKANGIRVFTIGFEVNEHSADILQTCASDTSYFFEVKAGGVSLTDAFDMIVREVHELRLTN